MGKRVRLCLPAQLFQKQTTALLAALVLITSIPFPMQNACAQQNVGSLVRQMILKARNVEDSGDPNEADALYVKALAEAEKTGTKRDVIEIISRLVRVRINNHKMAQTEPLVKQAIEIETMLKAPPVHKEDAALWSWLTSIFSKKEEPPVYDSEMGVWMDDMASAFYDRGAHTTNEQIKEYCVMRYLDIELAGKDDFDPMLLARANSLCSYLQPSGRYAEALPYVEKTLAYLKRTKSNDSSIMAGAYHSLGLAYLLANNPGKAEFAFKQKLQLKESRGKDIEQEAKTDMMLGLVKFEEGQPQAARALYQEALKLTDQYSGGPWAIGRCKSVWAMLEERCGNLTEAAKLFQASLDCCEKSRPPAFSPEVNRIMHFDGEFYSPQVVSAEHLAQIAQREGNSSLARSLQTRAKKIRDQHPYWRANNPDPDFYYMIAGHLPFSADVMPGRAH